MATRTILTVVVSTVLAGLIWAVAPSAAQKDEAQTAPAKQCRIGDLDQALIHPNPYGGEHPFSVLPTIVGCGHSAFGRVSLVAYDITRPAEFCFGVNLPRLGVLSGGACKAQDESWTTFICPSGFCIGSAFGVAWKPHRGFQATVVSGVSTTPVERIRVVGREGARERRSIATVGNISGRLAAKFHQTEPFVVFGAALPCMPAKAFTAESSEGVERLTAPRRPFPELFKHPCHPPPPPKAP